VLEIRWPEWALDGGIRSTRDEICQAGLTTLLGLIGRIHASMGTFLWEECGGLNRRLEELVGLRLSIIPDPEKWPAFGFTLANFPSGRSSRPKETSIHAIWVAPNTQLWK